MKKDLLPHPKQQVPFTKMDGIHTLSAPKPHSLCTFFDPTGAAFMGPVDEEEQNPHRPGKNRHAETQDPTDRSLSPPHGS